MAEANVIGGIVDRAVQGQTGEQVFSTKEATKDAALGAAGNLAAAGVAKVVEKVSGGAFQELSRQAGRARTPNRAAKVSARLSAAREVLERKQTIARRAASFLKSMVEKLLKRKRDKEDKE